VLTGQGPIALPRAGREYNHDANSFQANPNKCEQALVNLLSFASAYFCESGLFNGLQAKK
jgi:hypothetical protein